MKNDRIMVKDLKPKRDFIYVDDLVNAIIQSSRADKVGGEVFQIATNKETSINDIIKMLTLIFSEITSQDINVKKGNNISKYLSIKN